MSYYCFTLIPDLHKQHFGSGLWNLQVCIILYNPLSLSKYIAFKEYLAFKSFNILLSLIIFSVVDNCVAIFCGL